MGDQCRIDDCARPIHIKSLQLCNGHYLRLRRHGDPLASAPKLPPKGLGHAFGYVSCANELCQRTAEVRLPGSDIAVCNKHYQRAIAGKDWTGPDKPRAPDGLCQVDDCINPVRSGHSFICDTHFSRRRRESKLGDGPIHPPCRYCDSPTTGNQSRFCSDKCALAHRRSILRNRLKNADIRHRDRARRLGVPFEAKVDLMAVVERDGWICYICGEAIPQTAKRPDRNSLSIDHEHALANGGGHTFANCRASHLGCNFEKAHKHDNKLSAKSRRLRGLSGQRARRERNGPTIKQRPTNWPKRGFDKSKTRGFDGKVRERT